MHCLYGHFPNYSEAYLTQLRLTYRSPDPSPVPGRRERLGVSFTLEHPRERLVLTPSRRANVVFNLAEVLWYLSGRNDLDFIAYYAPSIVQWSRDGRTLSGSAYGPRFLSFGEQGIDQWDTVGGILRREPLSTRAVVQVFNPSEIHVPQNRDIACTLAIQFLLRAGRLTAITFMRANDAFRGALSDVFAFTFLQELLARQLGVELGDYHHHVGSFHTIDSDSAWIETVLADEWRGCRDESLRFPVMPAGDNWAAIRLVLEYEEALRRDRVRLSPRELEKLPLDTYWQQVLALFELHRQLRHGTQLAPRVTRILCPVLARAVLTRWPRLGLGET